MNAAGACTAGVSVSTLAKCVKDGGTRSRAGSGSGGGADCLFHVFFFVPAPLFVLLCTREAGLGELKEQCWEFTRVGEHKLMSDLSWI